MSEGIAEPQEVTSPTNESDAKAKIAKEIAAGFTLESSTAIAEQTAKAFEATAAEIETTGNAEAGRIAAAITERIATDLAGGGELAGVLRERLGKELGEHLPAVVANQADSLRQVARALRSAVS
jgi:hypothetical protein